MLSKEYRDFYERESERQSYMYSQRPDGYSHNRIRHIVNDLIKQILPKTYLDVGCAEGSYTQYAYECGAYSIGLDVSLRKLIKSRTRFKGVDCVCSDAQNLPFHDNSFEMVSALEVLEHLPSYEHAFDELFRVSGKYVIVSVPVGISSGAGHVNFFNKKDFEKWGMKHKLVMCYGVFTYFMPLRRTIAIMSFGIHRYLEFLDSLVCKMSFLKYTGTHIVLVFEK